MAGDPLMPVWQHTAGNAIEQSCGRANEARDKAAPGWQAHPVQAILQVALEIGLPTSPPVSHFLNVKIQELPASTDAFHELFGVKNARCKSLACNDLSREPGPVL